MWDPLWLFLQLWIEVILEYTPFFLQITAQNLTMKRLRGYEIKVYCYVFFHLYLFHFSFFLLTSIYFLDYYVLDFPSSFSNLFNIDVIHMAVLLSRAWRHTFYKFNSNASSSKFDLFNLTCKKSRSHFVYSHTNRPSTGIRFIHSTGTPQTTSLVHITRPSSIAFVIIYSIRPIGEPLYIFFHLQRSHILKLP